MINVNTGGNLAPTPREQFFTWELDAKRTMSLKVNDVASDRQKQRQLLNKDFRKLVEESAILKKDESVADTVTVLSNPTLNGTAKVQSQNGTAVAKQIIQSIVQQRPKNYSNPMESP